MKKKIEILQIQILNGKQSKEEILLYFQNKRWKRITENKFITKYASTNFHLIEKEEDLLVNIWIEGAFGVIIPYKNNIIGALDKKGFNDIIYDFETYLKNGNISYKESSCYIQGLNQQTYIAVGVLVAIALASIIYIIL